MEGVKPQQIVLRMNSGTFQYATKYKPTNMKISMTVSQASRAAVMVHRLRRVAAGAHNR